MPPDYSSVDAKLRRAEEHFECVHRKASEWMDTNPIVLSPNQNLTFTKYALIAKFRGRNPDLESWTLIIGDCINNLRCALDHTVYAIGVHQGSPNKGDLGFIISEFPKEFDKSSGKKLFGLSHDVVAAIKSVQPFNRPNAYIPPLLLILRRLSNADKHHLIRLAFTSIAEWRLNVQGPPEIDRVAHFNEEGIVDNSVVCFIESSKPDPHMYLNNPQIGCTIAIWHDRLKSNTLPMADRSDFDGLLTILIEEVKFVIRTVKSAVT